MELKRKESYGVCGIYCIINKINGKRYVGKSINIYKRIVKHVSDLNKKSKNSNQHITNSWFKYGKENFYYEILEICEKNENILKDKELYYMDKYNTNDRNFGYNLRRDSSTKMIISEETRKKLSIAQIKRFKCKEERKKLSISSKNIWKDKEKRKLMGQKVSKAKEKYMFHQYDRNNNFVKTHLSVKNIIKEYPSYKWQNIYAVCNGYKPTYMGFIWKKELKI